MGTGKKAGRSPMGPWRAVGATLVLSMATCARRETTIRLNVRVDPSWDVEQLRVLFGRQVGGEDYVYAPQAPSDIDGDVSLLLVIDDSEAGEPLPVALWGVRHSPTSLGTACGQVEVTPVRGGMAQVDVVLSERACGSSLDPGCLCAPIGLPEGCAAWEGWGKDSCFESSCAPVFARLDTDGCAPRSCPASTMLLIGESNCVPVCTAPGGDWTCEPCEGLTLTDSVTANCFEGDGLIGGTVGPAVTIPAAGAIEIRGVTITGCPSGGILLTGSGDITLTDVVVQGCGQYGIKTEGPVDLTIRHSRITGTVDGPGVWVTGGATLHLDHVEVSESEGPGVHLEDAAFGTDLRSSIVAKNALEGILVGAGMQATVSGCVVHGNGRANGRAGIAADKVDVVEVERTLSAGNGGAGISLSVVAGDSRDDRLMVTESLLTGNAAAGILVQGDPLSSDELASSASVSLSLISSNVGAGVLLRLASARIDTSIIRSTVARDPEEGCAERWGHGIAVVRADVDLSADPAPCDIDCSDAELPRPMAVADQFYLANNEGAGIFVCGGTGTFTNCSNLTRNTAILERDGGEADEYCQR